MNHRFSTRTWLTTCLLSAPVLVQAQSITYAPATSIPTLSQWGALALAALVAAAGIVMSRRLGSKAVMVLALAGAAALSAGSGSWIQQAMAIPGLLMTSNSGGTIDLSGYGADAEIVIYGNPDIRMRILSVTPASAPTIHSPTCVPGMVLEAAYLDTRTSAAADAVVSRCYYHTAGGGS